MSMLRWLDLPFSYTTTADFEQKLIDWLGNVFYDWLPGQSYELREEQIYTSYQIARALCHQQVLFAEAAAGTGKTFAYLLASLCYARMQGRPVILSSASTTLQQQLIGPSGDISTLSRLLDLKVDARLAKDPRNYLCQLRAERINWPGRKAKGLKRLISWAETTRLGDRAEIPEIDDKLWSLVGWEETLACERCRRRGYCQVAEVRRHYYEAQDFVICNHEIFFQHLWSRQDRLEEKRLPLLPDFSAAVLDEGHLVEEPAIKYLGQALRQSTIDDMMQNIQHHSSECRLELLLCIEGIEKVAKRFFAALQGGIIPDPEADKWFLHVTDEAAERAKELSSWIDRTADNVAIETGLHIGTVFEHYLNTFIHGLDNLQAGLRRLLGEEGETIKWWEPATSTLWVLPRDFSQRLGQALETKAVPLIFTSATLQTNGSFSAMERMVGLPNARHARAGTSFDLSEQVVAYLPELPPASIGSEETAFAARASECLRLIKENGGSALVLLSSKQELGAWRELLKNESLPLRVLLEGEADRGWLIEQFRKDTSSVLIGTSFWEGIDVPGEALSLLIIFSLPYPWKDPLTEAKRQDVARTGADPREAVDKPAMLIKLRQGFGRLIRKASDRGVIAVLDQGPDGCDRELIIDALGGDDGPKVTTCWPLRS